MGLPVEQIMAEVEEELLNMDEEVNEELEHMVDEVDELVEVQDGWLWTLHKQRVYKNHDRWICENFREYKCPFKIITTKEESENGMKIVIMTKKNFYTVVQRTK